jgi:hypothetical protein
VAGIVLVVAALFDAPTFTLLEPAYESGETARMLVFSLAFSFGAALAALVGMSGSTRVTASLRTIVTSAAIAFLAPLALELIDRDSAQFHAPVWLTVGSGAWGAAMAVPALPLVHAVVEARKGPSHDALHHVFAMACGFLFAVKLPAAVGALMLDEYEVAGACGVLAACGVAGFAFVERRRLARKALVQHWLEYGDDTLTLAPDKEMDDVAPLFAGTPRLVVSRAGASFAYRDPAPETPVAVVPAEPRWPNVGDDLRKLAPSAGVAVLLACFVVAVAWLGRSV